MFEAPSSLLNNIYHNDFFHLRLRITIHAVAAPPDALADQQGTARLFPHSHSLREKA